MLLFILHVQSYVDQFMHLYIFCNRHDSDPDVNTAIGSGISQTSNYNADIQGTHYIQTVDGTTH